MLRHYVALFIRKQQGQPKICYFGVVVLGKQDVTSFDVSMDDPRMSKGMEVVQAASDSQADLQPHRPA